MRGVNIRDTGEFVTNLVTLPQGRWASVQQLSPELHEQIPGVVDAFHFHRAEPRFPPGGCS
ncbi:hypothetical protein ACWCXB_35900 [Streptomyces sp. NPDC001514]